MMGRGIEQYYEYRQRQKDKLRRSKRRPWYEKHINMIKLIGFIFFVALLCLLIQQFIYWCNV